MGLLSSEEKQQERLKRVLDDEEAQMLRAFASARVLVRAQHQLGSSRREGRVVTGGSVIPCWQIEEQLTKRRIERDEKKRILKEEQVKLKRLEKLTAAFKRKQKSETEKVGSRTATSKTAEQRSCSDRSDDACGADVPVSVRVESGP